MERKFEITSAARGAAFTVRVMTRSDYTGMAGLMEDNSTLRVKLVAEEAGSAAANEELIKFFAELLEVDPKRIEIVVGHNGRDKLLSVMDLTKADLLAKLGL